MPDYREQAALVTTLANIDFEGGGGVLSHAQVQVLMSHPAYTDARHPQHEELSKTVRAYYAAHHPGLAGPHGEGG